MPCVVTHDGWRGALDRVGALLHAYDAARTDYLARTMHMGTIDVERYRRPKSAAAPPTGPAKVPIGD
jgi:hypothetical protein